MREVRIALLRNRFIYIILKSYGLEIKEGYCRGQHRGNGKQQVNGLFDLQHYQEDRNKGDDGGEVRIGQDSADQDPATSLRQIHPLNHCNRLHGNRDDFNALPTLQKYHSSNPDKSKLSLKSIIPHTIIALSIN